MKISLVLPLFILLAYGTSASGSRQSKPVDQTSSQTEKSSQQTQAQPSRKDDDVVW